MPIIIPQRLTENLIRIIGNTKRTGGKRAKIIIVLHVNHPNELDAEVCRSIEKLIGSGGFY